MQTSEEELSYLPGSILNQEDKPRRDDNQREIIDRLTGDLRELYEATEGYGDGRYVSARERAKNTLDWLGY